MGFMIARDPEAFSLGAPKGKKRPRVEAASHLKFVRELPCLISGEMPVHAAHIRYSDPVYGKAECGLGRKPDDRWTVPLAPRFHTDGPEAQHGMSERAFWEKHGIDPCQVALALWGVSGDHDAARIILRAVRAKGARS